MEKLVVSMDVTEAQTKLAEISWQYRKNWSWYKKGYYAAKALQILTCLLILAIPSCFAMNLMEAGIGGIILLILSIMGVVQIPKGQKERFFRTYQNGAEAVIERNGTNILTYELSEEGIVKTGEIERKMKWQDIHGYFKEEGWVGLFLVENGKNSGFVMIPEETLQGEERSMLNQLLEEKVTEKEVNWKKVHR